MKRRELLQIIGATTISAAFVSACDDETTIVDTDDDAGHTHDDDAGETTDDAGESDGSTASTCETVDVTISSNHPSGIDHTMTVSQEDVTAGVDKTYHIQGNSSHDHDVTVTAADFTTLASGGEVEKTSTSGSSHTHTIKIVCA